MRQGYQPTVLPEGLKTNGIPKVSTWGGPVVRRQAHNHTRRHVDHGNSASGGVEYEYHMFASTFVNGCNVWEWTSNSIITHAVSKSPLGPYEQRENAHMKHPCTDCSIW